MNKKNSDNLRSDCPVNAVLEVVGDKWTLLIVRDILLYDSHKYGEFAAMAERIPSNILANRLKRLVAHNILEMVPYQQHPLRYEYHLTTKGRDLEPLVQAMIHWGLTHVSGTGKSKGF
ncbi:MAG: transcriptional regulator [Chloroflexi bacterium]|nr:MAG: transcriptional regulator [Chloroflexota bacterium]